MVGIFYNSDKRSAKFSNMVSDQKYKTKYLLKLNKNLRKKKIQKIKDKNIFFSRKKVEYYGSYKKLQAEPKAADQQDKKVDKNLKNMTIKCVYIIIIS